MAKAYSDFDSESYPWDSVWEYILDDRNFEDAPREKEKKKKPYWSVTQQQKRADEAYDSDSAYEEDDIDATRRVNLPGPAPKPVRPILHQSKLDKRVEDAKPKRNSRFGWILKKRLRRKKRLQESSGFAELPKEKSKVRFKDEEQEDEEEPEEREYQSDFGLSRVPSFLQRRNDSAVERTGDVSVSGNQSVSSETSSVLRLLQWAQRPKEVPKNDFENLSDDDLSDEVSVMDAIFQFEDAASDFDVGSRNRYRAKQKWRSSNRRRSSRESAPGELRRSFSDLFETRDTSSVQSSRSRRSRRFDDSSVDFVMETEVGFLVHVPKSIALAPTRVRRRPSFQGY